MATLTAATVATNAYCDRSYIFSSSGGLAAAANGAERSLDAVAQPLELLVQRDVALGRHPQAHLRRAVGAWLAQGPETPVREVEQHYQSDDHQGAGDPDEVRARVLDDLQAGESRLPDESDVQAADVLRSALRHVLHGDQRAAVLAVDLHPHLPGRDERVVLAGDGPYHVDRAARLRNIETAHQPAAPAGLPGQGAGPPGD